MRLPITIIVVICAFFAHAACFAQCDGAEEVYAVDAGDDTEAASLTAETGVGIAAGVAVGLHGTDVAYAGYYTMMNGVPQDSLTSQGLQAVGVPQDWANGIDAGVSMAGTVDVRTTIQGIENGTIPVRNTFMNNKGLLPLEPDRYYREYLLPTPCGRGVGPQRIIRGGGGEYYYTPDHYQSFIPLN